MKQRKASKQATQTSNANKERKAIKQSKANNKQRGMQSKQATQSKPGSKELRKQASQAKNHASITKLAIK
jgi:hypothetical protein